MRASQPLGSQTQWAIGAYTTTVHSDMKINIAEKRMRSTKEPTTSAAVMMAKVSWNIA